MTELVVDYRESHVIKELQELKVNHVVENLEIGDFQIRNNDGVIGIWERKTYADLASSIVDNRYGEQKHRITTSNARFKGYIIEGMCPNPKKKFHSLHPGTIESIKIGLTCRDGFDVLYSTGTVHTAILLEKLVKKLPEYIKEDRSTEILTEKYHSALVKSSVSSLKKENFTAQTCYLAQLCQMPHISVTTAKVISTKWSNMGSLVSAIVSDRNGTTNDLSELKVSGRRIGNPTAKRIVEYLCPLPKKVVIKMKTFE